METKMDITYIIPVERNISLKVYVFSENEYYIWNGTHWMCIRELNKVLGDAESIIVEQEQRFYKWDGKTIIQQQQVNYQ